LSTWPGSTCSYGQCKCVRKCVSECFCKWCGKYVSECDSKSFGKCIGKCISECYSKSFSKCDSKFFGECFCKSNCKCFINTYINGYAYNESDTYMINHSYTFFY
jgi:hypothetical protein